MAIAAPKFVLVAWDGEEPSWSIVNGSTCSTVDGSLAVGRNVEALWGRKKFGCKVLAMAGEVVTLMAEQYFLMTK